MNKQLFEIIDRKTPDAINFLVDICNMETPTMDKPRIDAFGEYFRDGDKYGSELTKPYIERPSELKDDAWNLDLFVDLSRSTDCERAFDIIIQGYMNDTRATYARMYCVVKTIGGAMVDSISDNNGDFIQNIL